MTKEILMVTPECEIVTTRVVSAPREKVFRAWTEPEHLKNWWGPAGFTNTFNEFDLRPGGKWSFIMHGPEKGNYPNECVFLKIDKPSFIAWDRLSQPIFQVQVSFEEINALSTKVIFKMAFDSVEECNKIISFAPAKNEENMDKLEQELEKMM